MMSAPFDLYDTENWDRKTSSNVTSMLDLAMAKAKLRPFLSVTIQFFHSHDMKRESIDAFKKTCQPAHFMARTAVSFPSHYRKCPFAQTPGRSKSKQNETGVYIGKEENSWGYDPRWHTALMDFRIPQKHDKMGNMFLDLDESLFSERSKIKIHPVFRNWWSIRRIPMETNSNIFCFIISFIRFIDCFCFQTIVIETLQQISIYDTTFLNFYPAMRGSLTVL